MFRKLKLKLTLFNLAVMVVIMTITLTVVYVFMEKSILYNVDNTMRTMSRNLRMQAPTESRMKSAPGRFRFPKAHDNIYFFARLSPDGNDIELPNNSSIPKDILKNLAQSARRANITKGSISYSGQNFRYLINSQNKVIVFANTEIEHETLERLLTVLISTGLIGVILFVIGGFFLSSLALKPIKISSDKQKAFIADASHELRTPLAVIQTTLELVQGNPNETVESQSKWLENILTESQRMTKLVDNLLTLARSDSGQLTLEKKSFELTKAVGDTVEPYIAFAQEKNITINMSLEEITAFNGDELRIRQLLIILVDNAIKYSNNFGKIFVTLKNHPNSVELSVSDTGEGIREEDLPKVFERFYRVDKARLRESGGVGLGLSIAEWIVTEHNGSIKVSSDIGKGSKFTVELPK